MKVLLPIDSSEGSRRSVQFVGETLAGFRQDLDITLYHVVETLPEYLLSRRTHESAGAAYRQVIDDLTAHRRSEAELLLGEYKRILVTSGLPIAVVHSKLEVRDALPEARKVVAAIAIIEEMERENYSVVCLGRHGTSAHEGSFMGSVAEKVLREARGRTVWVIDG